MLQNNQKIIRHKVGLLNLAEELGNVSKACQVMGLSRDTFYRYRDAVEEGGVEALLERTRRVPNPKNRVDLETEETVVAYAVEYPAHGEVSLPFIPSIAETLEYCITTGYPFRHA